MITITYEEYYNDFTRRRGLTNSFSSLEEFKCFLKERAKGTDKDTNFSTGIFKLKEDKSNMATSIDRISCRNNDRSYPCTWVHKIEKDNKICFSDGQYTKGINFISDEMISFLKQTDKEISEPSYNFDEKCEPEEEIETIRKDKYEQLHRFRRYLLAAIDKFESLDFTHKDIENILHVSNDEDLTYLQLKNEKEQEEEQELC